MKNYKLIYLIIISILLSGCVTTEANRKTETSKPADIYITESPTQFTIKGNFKLDLPADWDIKNTPNKFKGHFKIDVESKLIEEKPLRSDVKASVEIKMTDLNEKEIYADFNSTLSGQHDGPPSKALTQILTQAGATIGAITPSVPIKEDKDNQNKNP